MFKTMTKNFILISFFAMLLLFNQATAEEALKGDGTKNNPLELGWSNLIPDGFDPETLIKKFEKDLARLDALPDGSEEGLEIIQRIQAAVDMVPSNSKLDGKWIKLPGFLAPLNIEDGKIKRFLLVPYFGACIHVPPPPVNQTVLVDLLPGQGITIDEVDYPFMITGKLTLQKTNTDIGNAGYHITQATKKIHHDNRWLEIEE